MSLRKSQENEVLDKEIHCPYCETDHAVLLTKITAKKNFNTISGFWIEISTIVIISVSSADYDIWI